ncbi:PIN domain-containing protein [Microbispora sp. CSR-4]|uniref:PIN domain-containing protein n=1 Tax=Microbispora sp. CSR-4 TaxID=2592813 RepID=UPI0034DB5B79
MRDPLPNTNRHGYPHPSQLTRPPRNSARFIPSTILIEAGWTINRHMGSAVHAKFLDLVTEEFELVELLAADVRRMAELVRLYRDARLDPADVSVVAIAERLGITQIATIDRRDFGLIRPQHVAAFKLLPEVLA